jgi:hypothetical protein
MPVFAIFTYENSILKTGGAVETSAAYTASIRIMPVTGFERYQKNIITKPDVTSIKNNAAA